VTEAAPRVSVILIFLDGREFLDEAVASVMAQTMTDLELLLCDDGSTDGSSDMAQAWAARHPGKIRCLEHEHHANRGMSATRNLGIGAAQGEFIAFIDVDDVWHPHKLAEQVELMEAHPEIGMVCGTVRYWSSWNGGDDVLVPTGHVQNRVVRPPETSLALHPLGRGAAPSPSDMLLRREAVVAVGGFEEHFTGPRQMFEDQGFLAKLYLTWPVLFADSVWLDYRQHPASIVATVKRDGQRDEVRRYFFTWFASYLDDLPEKPPTAVRRAVARKLRPYRRPVAHATLTFLGRLGRKARRTARRSVLRLGGRRTT
jgi:glycosyltransferase involved in cell wall biosynthesis